MSTATTIKTKLAKAWDDINSIEGATESRHDHYGLWVVEIDGEEYAVGTDEECDNACRDYIKDSLWAFLSVFVHQFTQVPIHINGVRDAMEHWQQNECESCNDDLLDMVGDRFDELVEAAVKADGRGHFLSSYDGEEMELSGNLYAYRIG